jgi:adenosine deaminase
MTQFGFGAHPMNVKAIIKALPQAEQHVHIVGSIRPETLLWLAEEGGLEKPFKTLKDARSFFQYCDFPHFITTYCKVVDYITKENQFERITYEMLENDARCNVRYVEASFSPYDHIYRGLDYNLMLDAINKGVRRACNDFGIECNLRIDLVRNYGPDVGMEILDLIEQKGENIVSVDIGGSEEMFPPKPYAAVYHRAKEIGLHLVAHAGEAAGPESVWDAVKYLDVERIGHGVAASRDPELMNYLLKRDITIEMCPTSNLKTRIISSLKQHPIRTFLEKGLNVTVSTDDPSMFGTDMNNEYLQLHQHLNFTIAELFQLSLNAVDSSFLPKKRKINMRESFVKEFERLQETYQ